MQKIHYGARFFDCLLTSWESVVARYALAFVTIAIAVGIALLLGFYPFTLSLVAIAVTVWYGGAGPGILAIILSMAGVNYFFHTIYRNLPPNPSVRYFAVFTTFGVLSAWLSASLRRIQQSLRESRIELEERVAERTGELSRSESELRDLIENVPAMVFIALPGSHNSFVSRGWREYTGLSAEATEGLGWQCVVHPEDL